MVQIYRTRNICFCITLHHILLEFIRVYSKNSKFASKEYEESILSFISY